MVGLNPQLLLPSDRNASGRELGAAELANLEQVIRSGHLNSTGGVFVDAFERGFAKQLGIEFAIACASGSAAVHAAIASLRLQPGDEIITTSITDMGAILPILYEGCVPVFADVDPATACVTAATIEARVTERTRAIIVTHLFGLPCEMGAIQALAGRYRLRVIEDAAQAILGEDHGRLVGTIGDLGCFSFQQSKHLTTGEGGMVVTRDPQLADRVRRFINKGWGYGDIEPDHRYHGLNFRLTELQAAVGLPQLERLPEIVARRRCRAEELHLALAGCRGLRLPAPARAEVRHSYWRYALIVDPAVVRGGVDAMAVSLCESGIGCAPHYIGRPAFACGVFRDGNDSTVVAAPYRGRGETVRPVDPGEYPGTCQALDRLLVLPWNECFTGEHVAAMAGGICAAAGAMRDA